MPVPGKLFSIVLSPGEYFLVAGEGEEPEEENSGVLSDLPRLLAEHPRARFSAVLDLPVLNKIHRFPFSQRRQVLEAIPLQLEGRLPEEVMSYEIHPQLFPEEKGTLSSSFLLPRAFLKEAKDLLLSPSLPSPPRWLTLAPWVVAPFLPTREDHHLLLFPDRVELLSFAGGKLLSFRIFEYTRKELLDPPVIASLRVRVLATLQELSLSQNLHLWGPPEEGELLEKLQAIFQEFLPNTQRGEGDFLGIPQRKKALALLNLKLLRGGNRPELNLAPPVLLTLPPQVKQQLRIILPLSAFVLFSLLMGFHTKTLAIRAQAEFFDNAIRAIFLRNLPGEKPIYPLRQLAEYKNRALENQAQVGGRRVDRIVSLTSAIPAEVHLILDELNFLRGEWTLKGKVNDFQEVDLLKEKISALPWVESLDVERAEQRQDLGKVEIRLRLKERVL